MSTQCPHECLRRACGTLDAPFPSLPCHNQISVQRYNILYIFTEYQSIMINVHVYYNASMINNYENTPHLLTPLRPGGHRRFSSALSCLRISFCGLSSGSDPTSVEPYGRTGVRRPRPRLPLHYNFASACGSARRTTSASAEAARVRAPGARDAPRLRLASARATRARRCTILPISSVLRFWISEGSTQAES